MAGQEVCEIVHGSNDIEKNNINSPSSSPFISGDLTSLYNVAIESEKIEQSQEISKTEYISGLTPDYNVTIESEKRQEIYETKDSPSSSDIEKENMTLPSSDIVISRDLTYFDNVTIGSDENRKMIYETMDIPSSSDIEKKNITLPSSDPVIYRVLTSQDNVTTESERVGVITENIQLAKELYLESIFQKAPTQGFYCPHCRTRIHRVLILDKAEVDSERFTCATCFSFLIPIGSWAFPWWVHGKKVPPEIPKVPPEIPEVPPETPEVPPETKVSDSDQILSTVSRGQKLQPGPTMIDDPLKTPEEQAPDVPRSWKSEQQQPLEEVSDDEVGKDPSYIQAGDGSMPKKPHVDVSETQEQQQVEEPKAITDLPHKAIEIPEDEPVPAVSNAKTSRWKFFSAIFTPRKPQVDISEVPEQPKPVEEDVHGRASTEPKVSTGSAPATPPPVVQEPGSSKAWDILKSIVYGGLIESIASLGVVASSASADATTLSILSLSLANLIGGLFMLVHHIWDLHVEKQTTNEHVDRYYTSLGNRNNFYLHLFIAILSFIIFGIVPPLVYGLTLYETNDKDLTLVAVAGASVICITLLSIAKAYLKESDTFLTYTKTVLYYLCTGALTSVVAYLVGVFIRKLLEKIGLSSESSLGFNLMFPEMSMVEKPRFGSY